MSISIPWAGYGLDFSLVVNHFARWVLVAVAFFALIVSVYSWRAIKDATVRLKFYAYLVLSLVFVAGAVLADNLALLLFFWEGLLITLFLMISLGGTGSFKTAAKALIIVGVADFCLMGGIALAAHQAGTLQMSAMRLSADGFGQTAFVLLVIGAIAKAGAMPFHSWIPDAAKDAPVEFMAFFPAAVEKLLGIYFLARITLDLFALDAASGLSHFLMWVGAATIILAVMMALIQKDYKKLLAYHAVSQVGYMILGIGTCLPAGIVGGLFHLINNAVYKCCLFLTAGAVERQTRTTDLAELGGLARVMPVTFGCFLIAAASISGVPPLNGFFSKELVYEAARHRGMIFYVLAAAGSFFTAASFLKLGSAAFFGPRSTRQQDTKEAPFTMLVPMIVLAAVCVFFGIGHALPLEKVIAPVLEGKHFSHAFTGFHLDVGLTVTTLVILALALAHHFVFARRNGGNLKAADHIHHAPVLSSFYAGAKKGIFDAYQWGRFAVLVVAGGGWFVDRFVDMLYRACGLLNIAGSLAVRRMHSGYYVTYIVWALLGSATLLIYLLKGAGG